MYSINMEGVRGISLIVIVLFSVSFVAAVNVGVSPANIQFNNVLRGGYIERPVTITIDSEDDVGVTTQTRGEIADWISFDKENFSVSRGSPKRLMISVTPPEDTPNGNYSGFVRIKSSGLGSGQDNSATGVIIPALDIYVQVMVTDREYFECRANEFEVQSAEKGDNIIFTMNILNKGNVKLSPKVSMEIWDSDSINLVKKETYSDTEIIPSQEDKLMIEVSTDDLEIGQYWVDVTAVDCLNSQTLTFDVLEEGALRANGVLEEIIVPVWAKVGDIVPINALFTNTGEKALKTRFSGEITRDGKIVQLLRSDEDVFVPMEESGEFNFYFTPSEAGKYVISGRALYDGKKTFEKSGILNVNQSKSFMQRFGKTLLTGLIIIVISILLFNIRKERQAFKIKSRGIKR